ncbi:MAG: hypothetical protein WC577_03075 [Candidatus Paceibacterota bacterium]
MIAVLIGVAAAALLLAPQRRVQAAEVEPCDDCPGRPDCRCADGHTDPTTCTCGPGWFARRAATETDPARRAAWRMLARLEEDQ